jgi:hypothetical protein
LLSSLLAIGIKMAHTLGLHKLGGPARALKARAESGENSETDYVKEHLIEIELGKRIWWALVQEDWFAIPFRGVWGRYLSDLERTLTCLQNSDPARPFRHT